jgi:hypothetical protein
MAVTTPCATLLAGQNSACTTLKRKYYQQVVVMNKSDLENVVVTKTDFDAPTPECSYKVTFNLKDGKTGYLFAGSENGSVYFGSFDKSTSDLGFPQYLHKINMLVVGADEQAKCILDALDKGLFVVAAQFTDGTVEIYGIENGLSTADYTYDVQGGGGGSVIVMNSLEATPEGSLPLVYESAVPGNEDADFNDLFANSGS